MLDILNRLRLAEETAGLEGVPGGTGPDSEEEEEEEEGSQEGGSLEGEWGHGWDWVPYCNMIDILESSIA